MIKRTISDKRRLKIYREFRRVKKGEGTGIELNSKKRTDLGKELEKVKKEVPH